MGFILTIVARVLFLIVWSISPIIAFLSNLHRRSFWKFQNRLAFTDALELDIYANYACRHTWNLIFQLEGYEFGVKGETISSALGKNQRDGTLTWVGLFICFILDTLDKDHCQNSIKN